MKKQLITPITNQIKESNLNSTLDVLINQFNTKLQRGKIKMDSVNDFTKLVNAYLLLEQHKSLNKNQGHEHDYKIHSLIDEDDPMVQEMYSNLFDSINKANDENNKED